jgi:hypothetical protein
MIIAQNIIYQPLMAIVGLLRHIGIQLMTLMTPIIPFFKSLDKSLSIKQRSSLFLNLKTGTWLSAKSLSCQSDFYPYTAITKDSDFALKLSILKSQMTGK